MKKVINYLLELGLTEIESLLYEGLLEIGPTSVKEIAEYTNIKRITAHFNIESLIAKGLVTQTFRGTRRQIIAEPPTKLHRLVTEKLETAKNIEKRFPLILDSMKSQIPKNFSKSKIELKYYEGKQSVMNIYDEALKAKEFRAYVNPKKLLSIFTMNIDLFVETFNERKEMQIWEIMEDSEETRLYINKMPKNNRFHYKIVPKGIDLGIIDYMIFDNKVGIVSFDKYVSGILISGRPYYINARALHSFVWQMLP